MVCPSFDFIKGTDFAMQTAKLKESQAHCTGERPILPLLLWKFTWRGNEIQFISFF